MKRKINEIKLLKYVIIMCLVLNISDKFYLEYFYKKILLSKRIKKLPLIKIFIMTHKDFKNRRYNNAYVIVGDDKSKIKNRYNLTVLFAERGYLYNKSRAYGEMAKLNYIYQLYKEGNISSKYIGLNHYSRYFEFTDKIPDLDKIFINNDVILPRRSILNGSIMKRYCLGHICKNFIDVMDIIKIKHPDYYKTALKVAKENKIYYFNIFIMKKEDFFKYCEFMFDILSEFDKRYNFKTDKDILNYTYNIFHQTKIAYRQSRLQGFLSERLSNIFYNKHFKRIKEYKLRG